MKLLSLIAGGALLAVVASPSAAPQTKDQSSLQESRAAGDAALKSGNALMEENKYCDAMNRYQEGLTSVPDDRSLLSNGGVAAYFCRQFGVALELWSHLKALDPGDWRVRAKLVQTYQALGRLTERDAERRALFELREQGTNSELAKQLEYRRDQFVAGGEMVIAFEHFELKGERALRYVFRVIDETGKREKYRISLGSYKETNDIWRETTKPRPKKGERLFHLDGYYERGHATYGMYSREPSYDEIRTAVIEILEKKRPAASGIVTKPTPE